MVERKVLMIGRHGLHESLPGDAEGDPSLTGKSIETMCRLAYDALNSFIINQVVQPQKAFVVHSPKKRAKYTGLSHITGAYGVRLTELSHRGLEEACRSHIPEVEVAVDPRLYFGDMEFNNDAYAREGDAVYVPRWIGDPSATSYDGVPITSFDEAVRRKSPCLVEALQCLAQGGKKLGVLATHSGVIEPLLVAAINSGRSTPVNRVEDIGGLVAKEQFALVYLDGTPAGDYTAKLVRDGQEYPINLDRLSQ